MSFEICDFSCKKWYWGGGSIYMLVILYLEGNHTLFGEKIYFIWKFSSGTHCVRDGTPWLGQTEDIYRKYIRTSRKIWVDLYESTETALHIRVKIWL